MEQLGERSQNWDGVAASLMNTTQRPAYRPMREGPGPTKSRFRGRRLSPQGQASPWGWAGQQAPVPARAFCSGQAKVSAVHWGCLCLVTSHEQGVLRRGQETGGQGPASRQGSVGNASKGAAPTWLKGPELACDTERPLAATSTAPPQHPEGRSLLRHPHWRPPDHRSQRPSPQMASEQGSLHPRMPLGAQSAGYPRLPCTGHKGAPRWPGLRPRGAHRSGQRCWRQGTSLSASEQGQSLKEKYRKRSRKEYTKDKQVGQGTRDVQSRCTEVCRVGPMKSEGPRSLAPGPWSHVSRRARR